MKPGSRIAIHSTVLPETCAELERRCGPRGIGLVDAPVSGGAHAARPGMLSVMCGGAREVFDACQPVFATFGRLIVLLGPVGAGQRAKIINNAMLAAHLGDCPRRDAGGAGARAGPGGVQRADRGVERHELWLRRLCAPARTRRLRDRRALAGQGRAAAERDPSRCGGRGNAARLGPRFPPRGNRRIPLEPRSITGAFHDFHPRSVPP